ncbi:MAG: hypothetical protein H0X39_01580 [Actinobacteria bacterium]|nr:hypothetical protein [Actinomycetota bacterium]
MRYANRIGLIVTVVVVAFAAAQTAVGSELKVPSVTANWAVTDHCNTGWCAHNNYTGTWSIVQKGTKLSGHDNAGNKLTGTISGTSGKWLLKGPTYSFVVKATFSPTATSFRGTWTDSRKASGTTKAVRTKTITLP